MRALLTAIGFLTIVPVPVRAEPAPGDLGRAAVAFPLVGLLIGFALVGTDWCGRQLWNPIVASAMIMGAGLVLTGGLHIDGFMDTADAFFSRRDGPGMLEVMRDSRAGALGVAAAICLLLTKFGAYAMLAGEQRWRVIALVPVLGRLGQALAVACFPYARPAGTGARFAAETHAWHVGLAAAIALAAAFLLLQAHGLLLAGLAVITALLVGAYWLRKLKGLTGDIYGAINEIAELVALLGATATVTR
jgi:adenosylcobinamide-GDP ribazoletransferase